MRIAGGVDGRDGGDRPRQGSRLLIPGLLLAGAACGAAGMRTISDRATQALPLESSIERASELRRMSETGSAAISAHHINIFNRMLEGVAELGEGARMKGDAGAGARRALERVLENIQSELQR